MNIGGLYKVKECIWLLFPTKETAAAAAEGRGVMTHRGVTRERSAVAAVPRAAASYWSKRFNCEVTYFSPDSLLVFLEEDGEFKRVLTADGLVGWTWFTENYNDYFEEVKP